ncbi:CHRD domain-containing protein [Rhodocytophaga rosea]|uniref:CHRD domain-containing protein n=1 Tax=Rhodocytophaga rosea TaxID=2704465 RepID=A0A6C0GPM3_9BACT|nr:CHRD domain-containing protein [Rhodocytophaga rosea]QHT69570.1 CHRD domain-containing protein [Rhodocytophaga rosea]
MKKYAILPLVLLLMVLLSSCELIEDLLPNDNKKAKTYTAFLSGNQEVPAVVAPGAGQAIFTLNKEKTEIAYKLIVANTDHIKFAHIHAAPAGENGQVVAFLLELQEPSTDTVNGVLAEGIIKAEDLLGPLASKSIKDLAALLESGNAYANIHTDENPSGELRGQIGKAKPHPVYEFEAKLTGSEEVPPVTTTASGDATYKFNPAVTELTFKVKLSSIENVKFAHIHLAPKGVNGGVVVTLKHERVDGPVNGDYAEGKITAADLSGNLKGGPLSILKAAIDNGYTYTNVHSDKYPAGEIRGQIGEKHH